MGDLDNLIVDAIGQDVRAMPRMPMPITPSKFKKYFGYSTLSSPVTPLVGRCQFAWRTSFPRLERGPRNISFLWILSSSARIMEPTDWTQRSPVDRISSDLRQVEERAAHRELHELGFDVRRRSAALRGTRNGPCVVPQWQCQRLWR